MYVQNKKAEKVQNMKRFKKLYEYVIDIQLDYEFIKRISIDEQTKTVWFELIARDVVTNEENWLIKDTSELKFERVNWKIKDFLLGIIEVEITNLICELNFDYKIENIFEQTDNGFIVNDKEFLLKDNNYADLREKVLKEVKEYALH